ncbi:unnamed protein product [Rhizoctonia solani]|uniref:L-lysine 6-oxidase n=1 Tax=Rhizoctonia solani TaxID=456999 RepID=A0A8H3I1H3_9AGAM|nr:unnamed protein product [Rhizoctonia solani]
MTFTPDQIAYVDIYPPASVAHSSEYFIGSEVPGVEPTPEGGFKDKDFKIKKQAARFRVYAFDKDSKPLGEVTAANYSLNWKVHVANKKPAWVHTRSRYKPESWQLRNPKVQGWPQGQKETYEYTNTRNKLIIDSGERTIEGANAQPVSLKGDYWGSLDSPIPVQLGELRTDEQGRLLVLASDGHSFSADGAEKPNDYFNNDGWVDSVCDGAVRVTVKSKSQPEIDIPVKNRATVITAPPRFASGIHCLTTLYELIEDIHERPRRLEPGYDVGEVVYYRDIYPLFRRVYLLSWTNKKVARYHGSRSDYMKYFEGDELRNPQAAESARVGVFKKIRAPVIDGDKENERIRDGQANEEHMPVLYGDGGSPEEVEPVKRDAWASLTQLQYDRLKKWSEGKFTTGEPEIPYESFDKIPLDEQPSALTKAGLEWTIGAALYPGIECFWIAQGEDKYKPGERFRFTDTVTPGDLGKGLALPWQTDFYMCNTHWWPSVRPDDVVPELVFEEKKKVTQPDQLATSFTEGDRKLWARGIKGEKDKDRWPEMVQNWNKLGFVARQHYETAPGQLEIFIERQRHPDFPL